MKCLKVEYPCGFKLEMRASLFDDFKIKGDLQCPLHGNKCVKPKQKQTKPKEKKR